MVKEHCNFMPRSTEAFCSHFARFSNKLTYASKRVGLTCSFDFKQVGDLSVVVLLSLSFIC